eukprot:TRINITY_DN50786_c0_g1_i1.p1 TRINITY_DN50786_c0_g1~~TRINITY_DN50786_c0_g1_i1.p1  ORF type:complete len:603 (+),score=84.10 TRINITY_DN50786_c0_g1_i1:59-1867(+)
MWWRPRLFSRQLVRPVPGMNLQHLVKIGVCPQELLRSSRNEGGAVATTTRLPAGAAAMEMATTAVLPVSNAIGTGLPASGLTPVLESDRAAVNSMVVWPRGTPLDANVHHLSVLSYNLLAPTFVRPIDKRTGEVQEFAAFGWAEPADEVLDWAVRRPRLLAQFRAWRADVLCLQEVQFEQNGDGEFMLPAWLQELPGYAASLPGQQALRMMADRNLRVLDDEVAIGCAVLYRTDRLELCAEGGLNNAPNTLVPALLRGREGTPLAALDPTAFFSVHLDARSEEKRVDQLIKCLELVRRMGVHEAVLAGDLNTECLPGSCVSAFVAGTPEPTADEMKRECASELRLGAVCEDGDDGADALGSAVETDKNVASAEAGPTDAQLEEWAVRWRRAESTAKSLRVPLSHLHTGPTRAGYDHGMSVGPCVSWRLDHILFTARTLELRGCWDTLEADPESTASGLPNRTCPSDHLPVASVFLPSPSPRINDAQVADLMARVDLVGRRQASERLALQSELDGRKPNTPAVAPPTEAAAGKKQKKGKERPSPEMEAFIRESRSQLRKQKELHAEERERFLLELGELELDAVDRKFCRASWVKNGECVPFQS